MIFFLQWMFLHFSVVLFAYPLAYFVYELLAKRQTRFFIFHHLEAKIFSYVGHSFQSMSWMDYLKELLRFQVVGLIVVYVLARLQFFSGYVVSPDKAFQLAASFVTNTNWVNIPGEQSWSFYLWILGLLAQNFLSAATGLSVLTVLARSFGTIKEEGLGNFYFDMWRISIYVLFPLSLIFTVLLISQGVPENLKNDFEIKQLDMTQNIKQYLPMGPIASFIAIRNLGTNGGGYTFSNGAHPYENPTAFSCFIQLFSMLLMPVIGCFLFGFLTGSKKRGWILWIVMLFLSSLFTWGAYLTEEQSFFGKEMRFGSDLSVLWHAITTSTATGSVNAMVDWFKPLTTGFYLFLMNLGEIAFGGSGMGVVNLIFVFITAAFIMNLLIGSSPSFLSKVLPLKAIKVAMFYLIFCPCLVLIVFSLMVYAGFVTNAAPNQVTALWYEISSMIQNNGSGFLGYGSDSVWFNYFSGLLMLFGRFGPIILAFAFSGMIHCQKQLERTKESFILESGLFCTVSIAIIFILTILAFLPLWSFGPLAGYAAMA